ncbi:TIP-1 family-domain-containing protein [Gamsiella multidivaricata]|uniref:TIP-1 family-domain-containing protein n=1 Tax=Gamsiella multidivaricata TaxID=101098 RepID=UPI00221E5906|nr:TIP-1 family-domain-containing protein [Gamsiella multidivaricata]KAG0355729.1 hypothetical protein BGZ54_001030 [Gamsiella multidivaricata]KAI7815769.1 TIP-1 family-domain-containing protein [Gamsiella multidivaricata]
MNLVEPPLSTASSGSRLHSHAAPPSRSSNVVVFEQTIDVDEDITDYFDAHFTSRDDLAKVKPALLEQTHTENHLSQKLEESKTRTAQVLGQAQTSSKLALNDLQNLESSALNLEEQIENSEAFAAGKNKRDQRSLVEELSDLQSRVQALEEAKRYIFIVSRTQNLISESKYLLQISTEKALVPYRSLVQLVTNAKGTLGGCNTKLEDFLKSSVSELLQNFKTNLSKKYQASLDAFGWPTPITDLSKIPDNLQDGFEHSFKEMLLLQESAYGALDRSGEKPYPPLLVTEIMVAPLIVRFRYHFEGKRPTNRLDKPEWYLTHILELIKEHTPFLQGYVQGIVQETQYREYDIKNDFIRLLLAAVERKIRLSVPAMLASPEMLSHAIHETLRFDKTLRDNEFYTPPGQTTEWQGTVQVYLGNREWLKTWLRVEKEFAVARYTQIIEDPDAWQPAYEDIGDKEYIIPSKSAEKLSDLLEIVTDRYRPLPVLEHKTFLFDIQLDLLSAYHRHIRGLVDQYESLTYSFVRVMPGTASTEELNTMGIDGLRNLCQWLSSSEYISLTLKDWGEDVFFLELYKEISERTQKVSNPLHSENDDSDEEVAPQKLLDKNGTIFDDTVKAFDQLSKRIQDLIIRNITKEVFSSMKPFVSLRSWPQIEFLSPESDGLQSQSPVLTVPDLLSSPHDNDDVSPELYQPLTILTHSFEFLAAVLPTKHFIMLYKQTSLEMQNFFWQKIIMKNSFSEMGGQQLARDFRIGLLGAGRRWIKRPENYHRKLRDAVILLSLQSTKANSPPMGSFNQDSRGRKEETGYATRTLAQIMAVLFDEDLEKEVVKDRLEEIGVMHLGVSEARDVVRRRVECWR